MKRTDRSPFLVLTVALGACSQGPVRFQPAPATDASIDVRSDASVDVVRPTCMPGMWYCDGAARAFRCSADGAEIASERCVDGARCVGGAIACGTCRPGVVRCSPDAPTSPELCAADGSRWERRASCDTASGERCVDGTCQRTCPVLEGQGNSYLGCEYWATPTANAGLDYRFAFAVVLANPNTREANISIFGGRLGAPITRTVPAGSVERVELPWIDVLKGSSAMCHPLPLGLDCSARSAFGRPSERNGAFRIVSDIPVAAYQFNPLEYRMGTGAALTYSFSADASLLLPQNVLGDPRNQEYIVVTRPNWGTSPLNPPFGGFVSIVGGGPSDAPIEVVLETRATVGDPMNRARTLPPGRHAFMLTRGEVLQLIGTNNNEDLTGTTVRANGPIAVFVGHDCTNVPRDRPACDHLEEQMMPVATWGRRYAVTFLRARAAEPEEPSVVRIVSQSDGNTLGFEGIDAPVTCQAMLNRGMFCEFTTNQNFVVTGARPILVMQYMTGLGPRPGCAVVPGVPPPDRDDCVGDPAMVIEVPTEQFRSRYDLLIPSTYRLNFVNLTSPMGSTVMLDGMPLDPMRTRGPFPVGGGLEVRVLQIDAGVHSLVSSDGRAFGAKVYGVASFTSYMYAGGLDLQVINPPG